MPINSEGNGPAATRPAPHSLQGLELVALGGKFDQVTGSCDEKI